MTTDKCCGTCRHWTPRHNQLGQCAVLSDANVIENIDLRISGAKPCPAWSSGDEYARGWKDAITAASKLADESDHNDEWKIANLASEIAALKPLSCNYD